MNVDVIDTDGRVLAKQEFNGAVQLFMPRNDLPVTGCVDDLLSGLRRMWIQEFRLVGHGKSWRYSATERPYLVECWYEGLPPNRVFHSRKRLDVRAP